VGITGLKEHRPPPMTQKPRKDPAPSSGMSGAQQVSRMGRSNGRPGGTHMLGVVARVLRSVPQRGVGKTHGMGVSQPAPTIVRRGISSSAPFELHRNPVWYSNVSMGTMTMSTPSPSQRASLLQTQRADSRTARLAACPTARLRLTRIYTWPTIKIAAFVSAAFSVAGVVTVLIVWVILDLAGVWDGLDARVSSDLGSSLREFHVKDYLGLPRFVGLASIVGVANVVLVTTIAALASLAYNTLALVLGGIDVRLRKVVADRDIESSAN